MRTGGTGSHLWRLATKEVSFDVMSQQPEPTGSRFADLALVLSGGGARACYQVGVLVALTERVPDFRVAILTGVSAGAINAASLAAHPGTFQSAVGTLRRRWKQLTSDQVYSVRPISVVHSFSRWVFKMLFGRGSGPGVVRGLMDMNPLRRHLDSSIVFEGITQNIAAKRLAALALSATSYSEGRAVTFIQGCEEVPTWHRSMRRSVHTAIRLDHVLASAAIPIVFPAVKLEDGFYGDGSVRQIAPLAPAIHLGARRLIAISMRSPRQPTAPSVPIGDYPAAAEVMSLLFSSIFLDHLDADSERLRLVNRLLADLASDRPSPQGVRSVDLLLLRPSLDLGQLARGLDTKLPRVVRLLIQGIGGRREGASDLLSYLLFEPPYTELLMEAGYSDTLAQWSEIEQFLAKCD